MFYVCNNKNKRLNDCFIDCRIQKLNNDTIKTTDDSVLDYSLLLYIFMKMLYMSDQVYSVSNALKRRQCYVMKHRRERTRLKSHLILCETVIFSSLNSQRELFTPFKLIKYWVSSDSNVTHFHSNCMKGLCDT